MRILAAMAAMGVLAACQTSAPGVAAPLGGGVADAPANARLETAPGGMPMFDPPAGPLGPEQIWRVDGQDNITHVQSGATCPGLLGGLRRDKLTVYRQNGMDVGCSYASGEGPTALRFYIFTSENGGLDAEMRVASDSMRAQQPVAKRAPPSSASQAYRNYALVETDQSGTMVRNSLLMTQVNAGWVLKVRLTCREADAIKTEELAARMLADAVERLKSRPVPRVVRAPA